MRRLYLYLARRDKTGMKLVTVLRGESRVTSKVTDLTGLKLPQVWERKIARIIHDHRMLYEPWVETAGDFNEIRRRMAGRGYSNLPVGPGVMLDLGGTPPAADTGSCDVRKTMIRKKST